MYSELQKIIEQAWENRELLKDSVVQQAIRKVVELVDKGQLRTAEPVDLEKSLWQVNEWVKKAIILYFPIQPMRKMEAGELEWFDKMDLKHGYDELGVRVVPQAVARYGAYIASGAILMPSYVISARMSIPARWSIHGQRSALVHRSVNMFIFREVWASEVSWSLCRLLR